MSDPGSTSMVPNSLTRNAGLRLGPIFFETLFRHYLEKDEDAVPLRKDELLYDEVFNIVKVRTQSYTLDSLANIEAPLQSFLTQASAKYNNVLPV